MGNCLGGPDGTVQATNTAPVQKQKKNKNQQAFQGTGHRLGAVHEEPPDSAPKTATGAARKDDPLPPPRVDTGLSDSVRDRQREERVKAAEARQKQLGGKPKKEKKSTAPLRGPNSEPTMRWTA